MGTARLVLSVGLFLLIGLFATSPLGAVTLTVDTLVDDGALATCDPVAPGDCSLKGAVLKANGLDGETTIEIPAGTYVLSQSRNCNGLTTLSLCLSHPTGTNRTMILAGAGAATTVIDANQAPGSSGTSFPVAFVGPTTKAEIRGLTLRRGNNSGSVAGGGGIRNFGTLALVDSVVSDNYTTNTGGGIRTAGPLSLLRTTVIHNSAAGDGGGIFTDVGGSVMMADSALVENSGVNGGGLATLYGGASITGSTISGNTGTSFGGAIYVGSFQTAYLTNTTVSSNRGRSAGGIYAPQSSTTHLLSVTIANNTARWFEPTNFNQGVGGGIYSNLGLVTLANTLIAGNIAGSGTGPDCLISSLATALTSEGHNLIQNAAGCGIQGDTTGNLLGQNPLLGALTQNGGPTLTHALGDGSPANEAGNPTAPGTGGIGTCPATDQRGFLRPLGARCDIGATERAAAFGVAAVLPATGGNAGKVSALVSGSGFVSGATVLLRRGGQPDIPGSPAVVDAGGSAISVTFDLAGRATGVWDVVVVNPDLTERILAAGFGVEAGGAADLWVDVVGIFRRAGRPSQITILYGNRGNVDAVGVPLWLSVPTGYAGAVLFEIAPPPAVAGQPRPDWSQVAPVVLTEAASTVVQVPLLLPVVPAGFSGILRIRLVQPLTAEDSLLLAVIGDPIVSPAGVPDPEFLTRSVAGSIAYVQQNFELTVPSSLEPDLRAYLAAQLGTIAATGRDVFANSLGTATQVYSLAHLGHDLSLYAVVRTASAPGAARPVDSGFARAARWLLATAQRAVTAAVSWLAPTQAWAAGAAAPQNCGLILGEGQSGCGGSQDTLRDILPPEIPPPPGCDPKQGLQFAQNKCQPNKAMCESLPGYKVVIGQGGQPFCVPENAPKKCSQVIDNPILGGSGNTGCKMFPLRPSNSADPNDKAGTLGVGAAQFILSGTPLIYTIHFENMPTATAAAQVVIVTDQLDPAKVDLATFRLGSITFGDITLVPAPGVQAYTGGVDLRPDQNLLVAVTAGVDTTTGLVTWTFVSIDPDTGQLTEDPQAGFLPPNTSPPGGEGTVVFTVMPKAGLASGTQITNQARIVFDLNAPIDTQVWSNTIDIARPTSRVQALAATQASTSFPVRWEGSDEAGGSGIGGYTVFVSRDGAPFTEFVTDVSETEAVFTGETGSTYRFCSLARDQAGNVEDKACPPLAEAVTTIGAGHDLAVVRIGAPAALLVTPGTPITRSVGVSIQNRSSHAEVLPDASVLGDGLTTGLVRLKVEVDDNDGEGCQPAIVRLDTAKNAPLFRQPRTIKPKARLTIAYLVTYNCTLATPRDRADLTAGDYRYTATVHHDAIDGHVDTHPEDDRCPHAAIGMDPNPDGRIKDRGCGSRRPDGTLGDPVVTNVYRN